MKGGPAMCNITIVNSPSFFSFSYRHLMANSRWIRASCIWQFERAVSSLVIPWLCGVKERLTSPVAASQACSLDFSVLQTTNLFQSFSFAWCGNHSTKCLVAFAGKAAEYNGGLQALQFIDTSYIYIYINYKLPPIVKVVGLFFDFVLIPMGGACVHTKWISLFHSLHKLSLPYAHLKKHEAPILQRVRLQIGQVDE